MVTLRSGDKLTSGVSMGGIGAGKVEINNRGKMVNLTIANNWARPRRRLRGFHVLVRPDDSEPFFMETSLPMKRFYQHEPDSMTYMGMYPFTTLKARKGMVEVTLEAFSPIIPNNLKDSTIPAIGISVKVGGSAGGKVFVSASNMAGTNLTGRVNVGVKGGVRFTNPRSNDYDGRRGELCLVGADPIETYVQYNFDVSPGVALSERTGKQAYESAHPWNDFIQDHAIESQPHELVGQWEDAGAAVVSRYSGASEAKYAFSWYFTGRNAIYPYGHYYHTTFDGAETAANYFLSNFERLRRESREWHDKLVRRDLPEWLRDAIINSTYVLSSNTWLDEKGRFAMLESTSSARQLGAIGSFCSEVGTLPLVEMFPELERRFMETVVGYAREDGYIMHDFGVDSMDHPTGGGTYPPGWKDIGSDFICLAYRDYRRLNDVEFLKKMYPKMVKAAEWLLMQDKDGDGLPDAQGTGDGGYDAMVENGRDSYYGSLFVAALTALRESSRVLAKEQDTKRFSEMLSKARQSYAGLFNGSYFRAWTGEPDSTGYLFLAQVAGDWWTSILDLEPIADKRLLDSAYDQLYKVNAQASRFCTPNMVHESGRLWEISVQTYSSWARLVFCLAGARYRSGDKKWLDVAKKEWDNLVAQGMPWDHPSRIDGRTGRPDPERYYLDHFIGSPALWTFNVK